MDKDTRREELIWQLKTIGDSVEDVLWFSQCEKIADFILDRERKLEERVKDMSHEINAWVDRMNDLEEYSSVTHLKNNRLESTIAEITKKLKDYREQFNMSDSDFRELDCSTPCILDALRIAKGANE